MNIILHFGMPKTGSSYVQSMLMINQKVLLENGIYYPDPSPKSMTAGANGHISSGHGATESILPLVENWMQNRGSDSNQHLLLSSELWFADMVSADGPFWKELQALPDGFDVKLVGFARDPFWERFSWWGQLVKRGGLADSFNEFLSCRGAGGLNGLDNVLSNAQDCGLNVEVLNYSRHVMMLWSSFLEMIGLKFGAADWVEPPITRVNRSLHWAETFVAREANRVANWRSSPFVADAFCNTAPDVVPSGPLLREATFDAFVSRTRGETEKVNEWLPSQEQLQIGKFDSQWELDMASCERQSHIDLPSASWLALLENAAAKNGSSIKELESHLLVGVTPENPAGRSPSGSILLDKNVVAEIVLKLRDVVS